MSSMYWIGKMSETVGLRCLMRSFGENKGVRSHCLVVDGLLVVHAGVASIQGQGDVPLTRPMFHFRTEESKRGHCALFEK
jgi:hypothetical protein